MFSTAVVVVARDRSYWWECCCLPVRRRPSRPATSWAASLGQKLAGAQAQLLHSEAPEDLLAPRALPVYHAQAPCPPPGRAPGRRRYLGRIASLLQTTVRFSLRRLAPEAVRARLGAWGLGGGEGRGGGCRGGWTGCWPWGE